MGNLTAQIVFAEEFAARDFNSSPLVIPIDLDAYDYEVALRSSSAFVDDSWRFLLNSDAGANYRENYMRGEQSSVVGLISSADSSLRFHRSLSDTEPTLLRALLSGASGSERRFSGAFGAGSSVKGLQSGVVDDYWKNTADNATTLTITYSNSGNADAEIVVFATPKNSSQGDWELINAHEFTGEDLGTVPHVFGGLNGDVDEQYKVSFSNVLSTSVMNLLVRPNGDSGTNYISQNLYNQNGTVSAEKLTTEAGMKFTRGGGTSLPINGEIVIDSVSGQKRLATGSAAVVSNNPHNGRKGFWWSNTADNITSLELAAALTGESVTGVVRLYRRKRFSSSATDVLPWETVEEVDISGDFSAGHTFAGLEGDKEFMYKVDVSGVGAAASQDLKMIFNSDTGASAYARQNVRGTTSSAAASVDATSAFIYVAENVESSAVYHSSIVIHPKSGEQRQALVQNHANENQVCFRSGWWTNTADELTTITVFANSTNAIGAGTLRLSRIRRIQP